MPLWKESLLFCLLRHRVRAAQATGAQSHSREQVWEAPDRSRPAGGNFSVCEEGSSGEPLLFWNGSPRARGESPVSLNLQSHSKYHVGAGSGRADAP